MKSYNGNCRCLWGKHRPAHPSAGLACTPSQGTRPRRTCCCRSKRSPSQAVRHDESDSDILSSSSPALFGTCAKLSSLPLPPLLPLLLSAFFFPLPSSLLLVSSSPLFLLPSSSSSPLVFFPRLLLFSSSQDIAPGKKRKRARRQLQGLGRSPRSQTPSTVSKSETTTPRK